MGITTLWGAGSALTFNSLTSWRHFQPPDSYSHVIMVYNKQSLETMMRLFSHW